MWSHMESSNPLRARSVFFLHFFFGGYKNIGVGSKFRGMFLPAANVESRIFFLRRLISGNPVVADLVDAQGYHHRARSLGATTFLSLGIENRRERGRV